jgi:hypothetical protein
MDESDCRVYGPGRGDHGRIRTDPLSYEVDAGDQKDQISKKSFIIQKKECWVKPSTRMLLWGFEPQSRA